MASEGNHLHESWINTTEVKRNQEQYEHWSGFFSILAWHQGHGIHAHIRDEAEGGLVPNIIIVFQLVPSSPL